MTKIKKNELIDILTETLAWLDRSGLNADLQIRICRILAKSIFQALTRVM